MKKNKAFTLIELIAVITLLALIVLVTVPVIINTLSNTEQKEYEDFKKLVTNAAELYVERNRNFYPELNEVGGAIDITADILVNEGYLKNDLENPVDNEHVSNYKIVAFVNDEEIINYEIYKRNNLVDLATISKNYDVNTIDRCSENGKCEAGTPFAIKVNDTDVYKFYVISDDGNAVTLIMNQNLYEEGNINPNIEWINEADYATENNKDEVPDTCSYTSCNDEGPITALNALDARTANWDYITAKDYTYSGLGADGTTKKYTNITRKMRVRMITSLEVNALKTNNNGTMPTWLYENLYSTGDTNTYGYWTSTARSSTSYHAGHVNTDGYLYSNVVSDSGNDGVRPVIEIFR